jgi:hypothetical protein
LILYGFDWVSESWNLTMHVTICFKCFIPER